MERLNRAIRKALAIERLAQRVDDTAKEAGPDRNPQHVSARHDFRSARETTEIADRREHGQPLGEADDLGTDPLLRQRIEEMTDLADTYIRDRRMHDRA